MVFMVSVYGVLWTYDHHVSFRILASLAILSLILLILIFWVFFRFSGKPHSDHFRLDD